MDEGMKMRRGGDAVQSAVRPRPKTRSQAGGAQRDADSSTPKVLTGSAARRRLPPHSTAVLLHPSGAAAAVVLPCEGVTPPGKLFPGAGNADPKPRERMSRTHGTALRALLFSVLLLPAIAAAQEGTPVRRADAPRFGIEARRDSVVAFARQQLGTRYVFGGTSPRGFDCSGFTQYLARAFGVNLPRTAAQQARVGTEVPRDRSLLRPGDLLTFGRGGRVTHIGVYVGDGRYVHASSGRGQITESNLDRPQSNLVRAWMGVRRVFGAETDSAANLAQRPVVVPRPVSPDAAPAAPRARRRG